jgi:CRISPR-associated protein Csm1
MSEITRDEIFQAALAGLLHDIGKIEQRARSDPWTPAPGTEDSDQPVHASWSINFAESAVYQPYRRWALLGAYHHRPESCPAEDKHLSRLVALADKLSAGERSDPDDRREKLSMQMVSIYDQISLDGASRQGERHFLPLSALALADRAIFPSQVDSDPAGSYEFLRDNLRSAAGQQINDLQSYLENMLFALQRYAWSVPSAYYHAVPDISLYDHSRMTAALAACLAERQAGEIERLLEAVTADFQGKANEEQKTLLAEPVALLIGGDLSGIQDFIYTISSKGAARMLRGRSFYLQLLTEAVLRFLLDAFDLPYCNVIYSGGGHFYLLAPLSAMAKLEDLRIQVTQKLLRHHRTALYLALGATTVPADGFKPGAFPAAWGEMHRALAIAKKRRYVELGADMYSQVFQPPEFGGNPDHACSICGEDYRQTKDWDLEQEVKICAMCQSFFDELGARLPQAEFIALGFQPPRVGKQETALGVLAEFGMQVQFLPSASQPAALPGAQHLVLWALDDPLRDRWPETGEIPVARALHYTVNQIPREHAGVPITFDDLQKKTAGAFHRLGVLRMDVDDMGEIFKRGLGEKATLARLAALSFQTSQFFEGWVKKICAEDAFKNLVYAVYAGGDDVFLIGPWDIIPGLAQEISQEFRRYTSQHPAFHISGGIACVDGKYPVYQAAADAFEALEEAKGLPGKAALTFLGEPWGWESFSDLDEKRRRLLHLVQGEKREDERSKGPQSILHILQRLARDEQRAASKRGRPVWGPWMWLGAYYLKRMEEQYKKRNPELAVEIQEIRTGLKDNNYGDIHAWGVAARWVQIFVRKGINGS